MSIAHESLAIYLLEMSVDLFLRKDMRVLVTGGAGYIGSQTAKALASSGFEPVVLDNFSTGHRESVKWGPQVEADLADRNAIRQVLATYKVRSVIHFAASAYVGESVDHPRKYFRNNVVNTLNLLEALVDAGIRQVVFSSSCATYGAPAKIPIVEDQVQIPVNPYGESKRFVENVLHWFGLAYGLRCIALRFYNAAGADPEGEVGEDHDPETHLIPSAIQAATGQRRSMELYGTDYPTPDGTAIRDYIHVADLAEAHVLALQHLSTAQPGGMALNLGTGKGHSVREVIAAVERVGGRPVPVREMARRAGDPPVLIADAGKARRVLGWQPRLSSLETIVETAWRWHSGIRRRAGSAELPGSAKLQQFRVIEQRDVPPSRVIGGGPPTGAAPLEGPV
jgi:UDP-arabinose 4-epimerase